MATADVKDRIDAPIEEVWAVVSDFIGMIAKMGTPVTAEGEGIGMTRTLEVQGARIVERLEELDPANHTTSYSIVEAPLPLTGYQAWIALSDGGDGTTGIRWWSTFEPVGSEEDAVKLCCSIYEGGIAGLKKILAPQ
ncbi:MAG: SRPBCC family protein [Actinomycetota bacterium]|nr:SRPBCC family protein [Actinomycetota bacterium]